MKKSIILFGGLLFLTTQSCDVLDKEPLDYQYTTILCKCQCTGIRAIL